MNLVLIVSLVVVGAVLILAAVGVWIDAAADRREDPYE